MNLNKTKILNILDKVILFSVYAIAYFLPISKAIIEVFIYLAIGSYLLKKAVSRDGVGNNPLNLAIIVYVLFCFFSIFISSNPQISTRTFLGKIAQNTFFFFALTETMNSEKRLRNFLYIFFISSTLLGIDGVYQYFTHKDFIRHRKDLVIPRIYATFPTPNDFGCYLNVVIPFSITLFFTNFRFKRAKFIFAALFVLLFICLIMTVSRGAWFAFMASSLFLAVWIYPLGIFFLTLALFLIIVHPFLPAMIKERLGSLFTGFDASHMGDPGSIERKIFWQTGWDMFKSRPWIGVGLGTFMFNFKKFVVPTYQQGPAYAHNCYLQMLSEIGIIGLVLFLIILLLFFYSGLKIAYKGQRTFSWYILLACLAAVLGYCVQMAVDTIFYNLDLGLLFWILIGLGVAAMNNIRLEAGKL